MSDRLKVSKVGFEVETGQTVLGRKPEIFKSGWLAGKKGVTIFPGDKLPADHEIPLTHSSYFEDAT